MQEFADFLLDDPSYDKHKLLLRHTHLQLEYQHRLNKILYQDNVPLKLNGIVHLLQKYNMALLQVLQ